MEQKNFEIFCKKIGYQFKQKELLLAALTHPSLNKQSPKSKQISQYGENYERLEFLGDKILSLIIASYLIKNFPDDNEGLLSKRHASLVCGEILAKIAVNIGLPDVLRLGVGEKKLGGENNKNNLENALEALIGAIYLDSKDSAKDLSNKDFSIEMAQNFILKFWHNFLQEGFLPISDPVSELQELVQSQSKTLPIYETKLEGGLAHAPTFVSLLKVKIKNSQKTDENSEEFLIKNFSAKGSSKKEAQRNAAKLAIAAILQSKQI